MNKNSTNEYVSKMNEWISIESEEKPKSVWVHVLLTGGQLVWIGRYIDDPVSWYGPELTDENGVKLDEEFHKPHWEYETDVGPFINGEGCLGEIPDATHWMHFPEPPKTVSFNDH